MADGQTNAAQTVLQASPMFDPKFLQSMMGVKMDDYEESVKKMTK